jgi:hypothetical protein
MKVYRLIWSDGLSDFQEWFSSKAAVERRASELESTEGGSVDAHTDAAVFDIPTTKDGILGFLNTHCSER